MRRETGGRYLSCFGGIRSRELIGLVLTDNQIMGSTGHRAGTAGKPIPPRQNLNLSDGKKNKSRGGRERERPRGMERGAGKERGDGEGDREITSR